MSSASERRKQEHLSREYVTIDEESVSLLPQYGGVYFRDFLESKFRFDGIIQKEDCIVDRNDRVVWVENPISHRFVRVDVSSNDVERALSDADLNANGPQIALYQGKLNALDAILEKPSDSIHANALLGALTLPYPKLLGDKRDREDTLQDTFVSSYLQLEYHQRKFALLLRTFFLFVQGLLAGFAFVTLYAQSGECKQDEQFLIYYQQFAQEIRRYYFILSAIATVGACDQFLSMYSQSTSFKHKLTEYEKSRVQRIVDEESSRASSAPNLGNNGNADNNDKAANFIEIPEFVFKTTRAKQVSLSELNESMNRFDERTSAALYVKDEQIGYKRFFFPVAFLNMMTSIIAYFISVVISGIDTEIALKGGGYVDSSSTTGDQWAALALSDGDFKSSISTWRGLDSLRFVVLMLAWICCAILVLGDLLTLIHRNYDFMGALKSAHLWRMRAYHLVGNYLENCSEQELQQLNTLQKLGESRSDNLLKIDSEVL